MIAKKGVCQTIVEAIIDQIKNGKLKPGDKLPNEKEMAEQYGVSRISLREALRSLSAKGLVVTKHGEGTFINTYDSNAVAATIYEYSLLDNTPLIEMVELRKIMESEAAKLACANATEEDIARIKYYKEAREQHYSNKMSTNKIELKYEYDRDFHLAIAEATHNSMFVNFIKTIRKTLDIHQRETTSNTANIRDTTYYHDEILKAIENRNGELAAEMMFKHIEQVENALKRLAK
jgi:GntR family transcriptional repressor for pyruvate dehydrogenase complex